jgi:dTDP-4-amino-4,6-dideoxygalactose transaminase
MFYELLGRRRFLPEPVTDDEVNGLRPPRYERRLSNAQAAIGLRQLSGLEENIRHRKSLAETYEAELPGPGFRLPSPPANAQTVYLRYPISVADRAATIAALHSKVIIGTWFTSVLEEARSPSLIGYEQGSCPTAEMLASHLINLPTHQRTSRSDAQRIVAALAAKRASCRPFRE